MKYVLFSLMLLNSALNTKAQDTLKMVSTAKLMLDAMFQEDYETLIRYTYPKAIEIGGGKEQMLETVKTNMSKVKSAKMSFHSAKLLPHGKIYQAGKELHCILPHTLVLKMEVGYISGMGQLLCISADGGKNWTYVDVGDKSPEKIKKLFPDFNPDLKIPAQAQVVYHETAPE